MKKIFTIRNVLFCIVMMLFIISAAVTTIVHFRPLYYLDVDMLNIPETSGFTKEEILENYDALIDYNSLFGPEELVFPTLPMGETGRVHFVEVKRIFLFFEGALIATGVILAVGILFRKTRENLGWLTLAGGLTIGVSVFFVAMIGINWQRVFVLFHEIVFANDYWIFNAETDPVILMLPDTFFMHGALGILLLVLLAGALCLIVGIRSWRHSKNRVRRTEDGL